MRACVRRAAGGARGRACGRGRACVRACARVCACARVRVRCARAALRRRVQSSAIKCNQHAITRAALRRRVPRVGRPEAPDIASVPEKSVVLRARGPSRRLRRTSTCERWLTCSTPLECGAAIEPNARWMRRVYRRIARWPTCGRLTRECDSPGEACGIDSGEVVVTILTRLGLCAGGLPECQPRRRRGRSWKVVEGHGRSWKVVEGHGRSWKVMDKT